MSATEPFKPALDLLGFTKKEYKAIDGIFKKMEYAEEEIDKGKEKYPDRSDIIHQLFSMMKPTPMMAGLSKRIYQSHCSELVWRVGQLDMSMVKSRIDLSLATDSEMIGFLSETAQRIPLGQLHARIYADAFYRVTGENIYELTSTEPITFEEWPGQADEEESIIKAKLAQDWRVLVKTLNGWRKIDDETYNS